MSQRKNNSKILLFISLISFFISNCTLLEKEKSVVENKTIEEKIKDEVLQQNQEYHRELETKLSRMIRNEIIPEVREISTFSSKVYKKQQKVKDAALQKTVIGRVEWINTIDPNVRFRARIDTGAQTCSLHAEKITEIDKEGIPHVEFVTVDEEGVRHTFLKKIIKKTIVKSTSGISEKRYVIKLDLMFGPRKIRTNVNLNDRTHLKHNFLVGRNLLLGDYIVDVSQSRLLDKLEKENGTTQP